MSINERLFLIMDAQNKKQKDFAEVIGVKSNTISEWKTRGTCPAADKVILICSFFGITVEWLLTGKGDAYLLNPNGTNAAIPTETVGEIVNKPVTDGDTSAGMDNDVANSLAVAELVSGFKRLSAERRARILDDVRMLLDYESLRPPKNRNV